MIIQSLGASWVDVLSFCSWLSAASGHDMRIPTEAEWLASVWVFDRWPTISVGEGRGIQMLAIPRMWLKLGITSVREFEANGASPFWLCRYAGQRLGVDKRHIRSGVPRGLSLARSSRWRKLCATEGGWSP